MTDKDFVENYRLYSPDSSMLLLNYSLDIGAFGYTIGFVAVLKKSELNKNLRDYTVSKQYINYQWLDNQTVSAQIDILPNLRSGENIDLEEENMNGIKIKVSAYDYIDEDDHLVVEHREISPNGQYELVAYRYMKDLQNVKFIHISIIPTGSKIPRHGNYLIADMYSDYVFYGDWNKDNTLQLYSNKQYADLVQYFFIENRPDIPYQLIVDDINYGDKYRWMEKSSLTFYK